MSISSIAKTQFFEIFARDCLRQKWTLFCLNKFPCCQTSFEARETRWDLSVWMDHQGKYNKELRRTVTHTSVMAGFTVCVGLPMWCNFDFWKHSQSSSKQTLAVSWEARLPVLHSLSIPWHPAVQNDSIITTISHPEPSNFVRRMLHENEGLWKGTVLIVRK